MLAACERHKHSNFKNIKFNLSGRFLICRVISFEERSRMCCPGAEDGISSGVSIGLGPVINFGGKWMQKDIVQPILMGDKVNYTK